MDIKHYSIHIDIKSTKTTFSTVLHQLQSSLNSGRFVLFTTEWWVTAYQSEKHEIKLHICLRVNVKIEFLKI